MSTSIVPWKAPCGCEVTVVNENQIDQVWCKEHSKNPDWIEEVNKQSLKATPPSHEAWSLPPDDLL